MNNLTDEERRTLIARVLELDEKALRGEWRHSYGLIFNETLRIARADFDTCPSDEFQDRVFTSICTAITAAPILARELEKAMEERDDYKYVADKYPKLHQMLAEAQLSRDKWESEWDKLVEESGRYNTQLIAMISERDDLRAKLMPSGVARLLDERDAAQAKCRELEEKYTKLTVLYSEAVAGETEMDELARLRVKCRELEEELAIKKANTVNAEWVWTDRLARARSDKDLLTGQLKASRSQLAACEDQRDEAKREAVRLATAIWKTEYQDEAPEWKPLDSVAGVISQIDNMYAGIRGQRDTLREQLREAKNALAETVENLDIAEEKIITTDKDFELVAAERDTAKEHLRIATEAQTKMDELLHTAHAVLLQVANWDERWAGTAKYQAGTTANLIAEKMKGLPDIAAKEPKL
jgi:chromosome segregation ATPase